MPRILSISGLRGVIGDGLDPAYVAEFAMGVGTWAGGGTVVLSRDGRVTGPMIHRAVVAGLQAAGCRVLDAGVAATPTCGVLVAHHNAAAGLQITASHNPAEWNGLKPFGPTGAVFNAEEGRGLIDILDGRSFALQSWENIGEVEPLADSGDVHLQKIRPLVDESAVRKRKFRVVLDCNRGSGGVLGPRMLRELGCDVVVLGGEPDGRFEHTPEPLEENLTGLCAAVREQQADVGFAQDPDADRLAVVDETGRYIGEELTLALCADFVLERRDRVEAGSSTPGGDSVVVINASTSRVTVDVGEKHGCRVVRSNVGEANVVAKMRELNAVVGGEGNGGLIEPKVGWVRDSFVGMAYILAGLARRGGPLSSWVAELPVYAIVKDKLTCPREAVEPACAALKNAFPDAAAEESDGLRLDWPDRWVQVRASNTEPIVRIIAEAPSRETAESLCAQSREIVRRAAGTQ